MARKVALGVALVLLSGRSDLGISEDLPLMNATFDADVSGWSMVVPSDGPEVRMVWSPEDANGSARSGSLELQTSALEFDRDFSAVGPCVPVAEPADYAVFGGRIQAPKQAAAGLASLSTETFQTGDCSGRGQRTSTIMGIGNANYWSRRADSESLRGARSLRLVAWVVKKYEWKGEADTGKDDDGILFHARFDDLFVELTSEKELARAMARRFEPEVRPTGPDEGTTLWGPRPVERPGLKLTALDQNGRPKLSRAPEYSSGETIRVGITLQTRYGFDDPEFAPLQNFEMRTQENPDNHGRRPTLELRLSRLDARDEPLDIAVGFEGGVTSNVPHGNASLHLIGRSDYRIRRLRSMSDCLRQSLPEEKRGLPEPTDDQLLSSPLAPYFVANEAGEYEIVATYLALESGIWHHPIVSEPLRIRIVRKDSPLCSPVEGTEPTR